MTLLDAIGYADNAKDAYKKAVGEQASLTSGAALALIPLSAAALGLGIAEADSNLITALGVGGAAGFGAATWLSSKPRQRVYIAGIKAMSCAVDAMIPLKFSLEDQTQLRDGLTDLNKAIGGVNGTVTAIKGLTETIEEQTGETLITKRAKEDMKVAEALLATAHTTFESGTTLYRQISNAGQVLISAVDRIGALVDDAIVETEPDIASLPGVIDALAQTSMQFTKIPESARSKEQLAGSAPTGIVNDDAKTFGITGVNLEELLKLNELLGELEGLLITLSSATLGVKSVVDAVSEARPLESLKLCGVAVPEEVKAIKLTPAGDVELVAGKSETKQLVITGGKAPYTAELLEDPVDGLTVKQPVPFGPRVLIRTDENLLLGDKKYNIYITDAAGHNKTVMIVVSSPD